MYNFMAAFCLCGIVILLGEWLSKPTKGWIPSVFISAVIILIGYWTVLPKTLVADAQLLPFGGALAIYMLITHMGTMISVKELVAQWRTVAICLAGLVGMTVFAWFICPLLMDKALMIAGLPPLAGGIVAATMMQQAAENAGLTTAAVFAISMYCIQGFAGYPLTAICLKKEAAMLLADYRAGKHSKAEEAAEEAQIAAATQAPEAHKRGILATPAALDSPIFTIFKVAVGGWIAAMLGSVTPISGAIWALFVGVVLCRTGFLEPYALKKADSLQFLMFALMMFVYNGLKDCTPEMLVQIIWPLVCLVVVGLAGMWVFAFVLGKILKVSPYLSFANCLTALYGFPFNAIITEQLCKAEAKNEEEREFLMSRIFPSMIIGGFVTVTITSVILAGIFSKLL